MRYAFLSFLFILLTGLFCYGQAGIYSESDIELQDLFIEAQLEKQKGNTEKQIELLREVTRRDRTADAAYFEMAQAYLQTGNAELAESNIRKALNLEPGNEWYLKLQLDILNQRKNYSSAIATAEKLVEMFPSKRAYHFSLAESQKEAGKSADAIQTLLSFQEMKGITEDISKRIFEIHDADNNIEKATATLRQLSEAHPGNVRFLVNLAGYMYKHNQKKEALACYRRILELDPDNAEANLTLTRESHDEQAGIGGLASIEKMISNAAIPLDDIVKEMMPFISNMNREGAQTDKLLELSLQLLERFPDDAKTHAVRADILFYSGNVRESEKMYASAIAIDDSKYTLWDQWLVNLWELEDYTKMRNKAQEAVDYFPNTFNAWLYYSLALEKSAEPHDARQILSEASLIAGRSPAFKDAVVIAETWFELRHNQEVTTDKLTQINDSDIISPVLLDILGDIYLSSGKAEKSRKYWKSALNYGASQERIKIKLGTLN